MDGFELLRSIRASEKLGHLPVVMITSRIADKHRDHAKELGANEYLGKPYSEDELLQVLERYAAKTNAQPATV
jgi:chemosensory pili system protein ChpA (sensor histidine kinase/response regulator)